MANFLDTVADIFGAGANAVKPKGVRNNNQGNIEDGPYARSQPGYLGTDGRFAKFATPEAGNEAQVKLIRDGKNYRGKTPAQIIQTYAPPGDNSDESIRNYIGYASARAGVDPDKPMSADQYNRFAEGMREFEIGTRAKGVKFAPYGGEIKGGKKMSGAGGGYNASQPGRGVADPNAYLAGLESVLAPETANSQAVTTEAGTIMTAGPELTRRSGAVEGQLEKQGQQIGILEQAMQAAHTAQTGALTQQIQSTRDVSNEIVRGNKELTAKVKPIFEAKSRVADQLDKINTMNPLERGLRGIFDLNYDKDYLEGQLENFDRTLKSRADDYNYINKLHEDALGEVDRRFKMDTALPSLLQEQANEDLGLVGMRLTQTVGMLDSLKGKVQTEVQMISAKSMAREDLLGRLDLPTISNLMTDAEKNGGVTQFNGVEFSGHELRTRLQAAEQQDLQVESYKMAIAQNRMDMAEKYSTNLARSLTRGQLEAAINNGGVYNGVQLAQDQLTSLYQGAIQRDSIKAETLAANLPTQVAYQAGADAVKQAVGLSRRARGLFGSQAMAGGESYLARSGQLARDLAAAGDSNQPPEVITALTKQIAANTAEYSAWVDNKILMQTGGDKRAAGYMKGFVYGTTISPGTAAEAMTYFAVKGSLPEGVALSSESKQVFQRAQGLVKEYRDANQGKKLTEQQIVSAITPQLTEAAGQIMGQARFEKLYSDLPTVAASSGHAFGKFDRQRWAAIRGEAQTTAAESVAKSLNTTRDLVLKMARTGKPLGNSEDEKKLFEAWKKESGKYNAVELDMTAKLLDQENQVVLGQNNSKTLTDLLGSPKFTTGLRSYGQALSSNSMGEYLANPLQAGATEMVFSKTFEDLNDTLAKQQQVKRQLVQNPSSAAIYRAPNRTGMLIESIPGVGAEGRKTLAPFVQKFFEEWLPSNHASIGDSPNTRFVREDAALRDALQATQFPDKRAELYRKTVLKNWDEHATQQQGFLGRLMDSIQLYTYGTEE